MSYKSQTDILNLVFDGKGLNITQAIDGEVTSGYKTVGTAGTAEQLSADTVEHFVIIKAMPDNTGNIYIGKSDVSATNGYPLSAGEDVKLPVKNLDTIYLDTDTGSEGVKYIGV